MPVYVATIILSVFLSYILSHSVFRGKKIPSWIVIIITALPAIFVSGLRYEVGTDYEMYRFAFLNPDNVNVKHNIEILYRLFFKAVTSLGGSYYVAVFISSAIFFILIYIEIFHDSPMPWLSTFMIFGMLFFFIYMNAGRQMIAISILLFSLRFLEKKRYLPFILCLAVAICIHRSSVLFILVLVLFQVDINFKIIFGLTPAIFIISALSGRIVNFVAELLRYDNYVQMAGVNLNFRFLMGILYQLIITILACYVYRRSESEDDQDKFRLFFNIQVLTLWTYAFSGFISGNEIARIQYMFAMPGVILTPMVVKRIPEKILKLIFVVVLLSYGILNIYFLIYQNNEQQALPYQSIIQYWGYLR